MFRSKYRSIEYKYLLINKYHNKKSDETIESKDRLKITTLIVLHLHNIHINLNIILTLKK